MARTHETMQISVADWMISPIGLDLKAGSAELLVYALIHDFSRADWGLLKASQAEMARFLCLSRKTVNAAIGKLVEKGYVYVDSAEETGHGGSAVKFYRADSRVASQAIESTVHYASETPSPAGDARGSVDAPSETPQEVFNSKGEVFNNETEPLPAETSSVTKGYTAKPSSVTEGYTGTPSEAPETSSVTKGYTASTCGNAEFSTSPTEVRAITTGFSEGINGFTAGTTGTTSQGAESADAGAPPAPLVGAGRAAVADLLRVEAVYPVKLDDAGRRRALVLLDELLGTGISADDVVWAAQRYAEWHRINRASALKNLPPLDGFLSKSAKGQYNAFLRERIHDAHVTRSAERKPSGEPRLVKTSGGGKERWTVLDAPGGMADVEGVDGSASREEALAAWRKQEAASR